MSSLTDLTKKLEAFETDPWAVEAILDVELMTPQICDPCYGTGILALAAMERGYRVHTADIYDWSQHFDCPKPGIVMDFLNGPNFWAEDMTFFMNPPFTVACEFVDRAKQLKARKIVCFQRWAWRESGGRAEWWAKNPPSRIWLCADRATCWRFDVPKDCVDPANCPQRRGSKNARCRKCMGNTTSAHGWFIWERSHVGPTICDLRKPKRIIT